jgi:hypothetical protein
MQWLRQQGCPWDEWSVTRAAGGGFLHVVEVLISTHREWISKIFVHLKWAIANGCPVDVSASAFAASSGHCEVLQVRLVLRDALATRYIGLHLLQHLYNLNIPLHSHLCMFAAQGGHLRVIMWAKSVGSCDCDPHRVRIS